MMNFITMRNITRQRDYLFKGGETHNTWSASNRQLGFCQWALPYPVCSALPMSPNGTVQPHAPHWGWTPEIRRPWALLPFFIGTSRSCTHWWNRSSCFPAPSTQVPLHVWPPSSFRGVWDLYWEGYGISTGGGGVPGSSEQTGKAEAELIGKCLLTSPLPLHSTPCPRCCGGGEGSTWCAESRLLQPHVVAPDWKAWHCMQLWQFWRVQPSWRTVQVPIHKQGVCSDVLYF